MKQLGPLLFGLLLVTGCAGGRFQSSATAESAPAQSGDQQPDTPPVELPNPAPETTLPEPAPDDGMIFKECNGNPDLPFIADLYQLAPETKELPDFTRLKPIKQICIRQLNITNRDFNEGFPGVEGLIEWFALSIRVKLQVPQNGEYILSLNSDDGSKLYLGNELVINNDGLHPSKSLSATRFLTAGTYDLRIDYFQGPRFHIALELFWQEPAALAKSYIPAAYLKRP